MSPLTLRKRQIAPCFDEVAFERDRPLEMRKRLTVGEAEDIVDFSGIGNHRAEITRFPRFGAGHRP